MEKKYLNIIKNYYNINIIFTVKLIFLKISHIILMSKGKIANKKVL